MMIDSASENEVEATFYLGDIYNFEDEELDDIQDLEGIVAFRWFWNNIKNF